MQVNYTYASNNAPNYANEFYLHICFNICSLSGTLLAELREYNLEQQRRAQADSHSPDAPPEDSSISARLKGKMTSRLASNGFGPLTDIRVIRTLIEISKMVWSFLNANEIKSNIKYGIICCGLKFSHNSYNVLILFVGHRFDGSESVVIVAAQKRSLGGRELQLPCMSSLTSKTSTQKFFLRVLQVIIQLREDTRRANKKAKQTGRLGKEILHIHSSHDVKYTYMLRNKILLVRL